MLVVNPEKSFEHDRVLAVFHSMILLGPYARYTAR